ncbi:hypothetical protein L226DRAFT_533488 [Lentinus tigrinus ALCF2SS1-7]|uniref:Chromo domain-containing protein n=1 Tax=Lentinus tigrinus ALCF2SS1-6 TaxID=1328759 RepID=A0A5C2SS49_9APHY|nr:hypothetical protein L227DRAFT_571747 [Lentinus tigrinus ALCF2SS1-6]RPD76376.1 hypothetical protein L226DRAFT_533488 [Lentinus tigrinus ALCF2SS1-7]
MAKATSRKVEASGSESESEQPKSAKKGAVPKNAANNIDRDASEELEEKEENGDQGDDDEEDEEEYEIEAILDAKHGSFPNGRTGYLVKWKNYGEEHNSWVDENDAQGAKELIQEFWKNNSKKGAPARKSDAKPKPTPKPRKSVGRAATAEESEVEETAPPAKKRGRPSKASARSLSEEQEPDEEAPKKKSRKGPTAAKSASARRAVTRLEDSDEDEEERTYVDMKKWKDIATWEHLVEYIDTVERMEDGGLLVYFTLKHGKGFGKEPADVCKQKMPNLLIDFYQSNLRWKSSDENAMEE